MAFLFKDITTRQIAQLALDTTKQIGCVKRRQSMQKRLDYFQDKQLSYLTDALNTQFEFVDRLKLQKEFYNITNLLINELAVLYNEEPLRELLYASEKEQELYSEIVDKSKLNSLMQQVNKLCKLTKTVLVRPVWNEREQIIKYRIYTPNIFDVIQDENDPTRAKAIIYSNNYPTADLRFYNNDDNRTSKDAFEQDNTVFHCWTDEKYFMFTFQMDKKGKDWEVVLLDNPDNRDNINPYGTTDIFVPFRDGYAIDDFFIEGGDDLIETNELLNIKLTELNYLIKMQSFSIPVRKGATDNKPMILDPSMTLDLPPDDDMGKSDFKFVSPDAKITEVQTEIEQKLRRLALKYRINPDMFIASGNKSSADSLQLQNFKQGQIIKADKPFYRGAEHKLFEMTRLVNNQHNSSKLSDTCDLMIDYREIELPQTKEQEDMHNLMMFNNGLITKADWLLKENPDLRDIDQAKEQLALMEEETPAPRLDNEQDDEQNEPDPTQ